MYIKYWRRKDQWLWGSKNRNYKENKIQREKNRGKTAKCHLCYGAI